MATRVDDFMLGFHQLNPDDQKRVVRQIKQATLADPTLGDPPDPRVTNNLWYIIVGTLAALAVVGLIAVTILVSLGKPADVVAPLVTLAIGGLVGIVAPSPTQSNT
jgi:hypothetical protein